MSFNLTELWNLTKTEPRHAIAGLTIVIAVSAVGATWYVYIVEQRVKLYEESEKRARDAAERHFATISESGEGIRRLRTSIQRVSTDLLDLTQTIPPAAERISTKRITSAQAQRRLHQAHVELERSERELQNIENRLRFGQNLYSDKMLRMLKRISDVNNTTTISTARAAELEFDGQTIPAHQKRNQDIIILVDGSEKPPRGFAGLYIGEDSFLLPSTDGYGASAERLSAPRWRRMRIEVVRPANSSSRD